MKENLQYLLLGLYLFSPTVMSSDVRCWTDTHIAILGDFYIVGLKETD